MLNIWEILFLVLVGLAIARVLSDLEDRVSNLEHKLYEAGVVWNPEGFEGGEDGNE